MNYLLASNNAVLKFPYSLEELRSDNPQTSFAWEMSAEALAQWGVYSVEIQSPPPDYDKRPESINLDAPSFVNGQWIREWLVSLANAELIAERTVKKAAEVREYRNKLLAETDYTQLADYKGDSEKFKILRQLYRDIPQQEGFPWSPVNNLKLTE